MNLQRGSPADDLRRRRFQYQTLFDLLDKLEFQRYLWCSDCPAAPLPSVSAL